jgi:hypothetical protein
MRNLTATIPGDAYRRAGLGSPMRHFHSPRSSAIASEHAPEAVIYQRFPVPNSNPSSHIPAADSPNPKQ